MRKSQRTHTPPENLLKTRQNTHANINTHKVTPGVGSSAQQRETLSRYGTFVLEDSRYI